MATIGNDPNGRKRILFVAGDGRRRTIRLGKMDRKDAERFRLRVEKIIGANISGGIVDDETSHWLAERDDVTYSRMAAVGLVKARAKIVHTVAELTEKFFAGMTAKPATRTFYGHTRRNLEEHFGKGRDVASVGPAEADGFKAWIAEHEKLSPATVAR